MMTYKVIGFQFKKYEDDYLHYIVIKTPLENEYCIQVSLNVYNGVSMGDYIEDFKRDEDEVVIGCIAYKKDVVGKY